MTEKSKVSIIGDGGWGTALALVNARRGNEIILWSAFESYAATLQEKRENVKFLPGVPLPSSIKITANLSEAIEFANLIILAVPTQFVRNILHKLKEHDISKKTFVSVAKGIEKSTCLRPSEIIHGILGDKNPLVILSGPSHAEEVARNVPTLVVAASSSEKAASLVQNTMTDSCFRIYMQNDVVGVELGGALKNVIAISAGICDGLGFGDNGKAGLLSRGLFEMARLGVRMGANPNTFFGLSGLGDLLTTCYSNHGRNLRVGRELGAGKKIKDVLAGMEMVAEGVDTAQSVHQISERFDVELPIMNEVYKVLFENKDPKQAVSDLLARGVKEEWKQY